MLRIRRFSAIASGIAAVAVVILSAMAAPANAASSPYHHLSRCTARGQYATCVTGGTTKDHPTSIHVHVKSSHNGEPVYVAWDVTCARGSGAGSKSGHFTAHTAVNRKIRLPYTRPLYCIVSADAQLSRGGSWIEVSISYWT
jgi:hypothetical protein